MAQDRVNKFVESLRGRQPPATVLEAQPGARRVAPSVSASRAQGPSLNFDPKVLAKLGHLELIAKTVVDDIEKLVASAESDPWIVMVKRHLELVRKCL